MNDQQLLGLNINLLLDEGKKDGEEAEQGEEGEGMREAGEGKDFREGSVWWRDVQSIVENVLGTFFIINIYI